MSIAAVVFDWHGTLADTSPSDFWLRLPDLIAEAGGEVNQHAYHAWEDDHPTEHLAHSTSETAYRRWQRTRLRDLFDGCSLSAASRDALLDAIEVERYARHFGIYPDVAPMLTTLRHRGLRLGLCSNWDWDVDRQLVANGIGDAFDAVVCSASLGYRKPHPAVFTEVARLLEEPPDATLFVGDSWPHDVEGSMEAGFRPVHIARSGRCQLDDHAEIPCIAGLDALPGLIG